MLISSWMWHLTRWDGLFLGTYLVTHLGGRPIDNQFVGLALFLPMLLGASISKLIRTRLDPRALVVTTELVLLPASAVMAGLVGSGAVRMWMIFPLMLAHGFGGMVNMTAQRELLFRLAGPVRAARAMNVETSGVASAMMLGPLVGGVSIDVLGLGGAFALPAVLLAGSVFLLSRASAPHRPMSPEPIGSHSESVAVHSGFVLLRRAPSLLAIMAVTVVANLCYFAFMPLVPVIAKNLGAGASLAGVIGSAAGTVQLLSAAVFVARPARRPGRTYIGGVAICLCCLALLSYAPTVALALLALGVAGIGQAMFGSMQATLPVAVVAPDERPAVLGLLSTIIGVALPAGMLILGLSSDLLGARLAMLVSAGVGLGALAATVVRSPGLFHAGAQSAVTQSAITQSTRTQSAITQSTRTQSAEARSGRSVRASREGDAVAAQPELG
jgi:predicted MFS family arabinose efflux permease